jgi:hypothetical protein
MEQFLNDNDSTKRMLYTLITGAVTVAGSKLGINNELILGFMAFMGSVIAGSNYHAAAKAKGADAAAAVTDTAKAVEVMGVGTVAK